MQNKILSAHQNKIYNYNLSNQYKTYCIAYLQQTPSARSHTRPSKMTGDLSSLGHHSMGINTVTIPWPEAGTGSLPRDTHMP